MSGVLIELARRQNTMVWLFEIDGLQDTYYSSPAAPTLPPYAQPWVHLPQPGIIGVTAADESLDVLGSIVQSGQVAVTIAATRTNDAAQLLKAGRSGAGRMVTLKTTLDQTGAVLVIVNEDISAWAAAGIIWIGREAIRYTARSVAAPYQFTIADADRGWFGSEQRKHVANVNSGWAPRIYDACVTWQGRKARVLVSSLRPDGSQSTFSRTLPLSIWRLAAACCELDSRTAITFSTATTAAFLHLALALMWATGRGLQSARPAQPSAPLCPWPGLTLKKTMRTLRSLEQLKHGPECLRLSQRPVLRFSKQRRG